MRGIACPGSRIAGDIVCIRGESSQRVRLDERAAITKEYADEIGADGFAPDASQAARLAGELMGETN